jgi:D-alanyl-D-alanine carboxypeptidase (penicillin-binding protein 5/6)
MMTGLLVLESAHAPNELVTIGPDAAAETGARLGLHPGDSMPVVDLLAAMLVMSANDACHALADYLAGSEAQFVSLMNQRARALGLRHTHFVNACGHDRDGQSSTAWDLAVLAQTAMARPDFARLAATVRLTITTADGSRTFHLENKNELIGRYPGAIGVKTGFTAKAGKCVIAAVERDGRRVLLVLLNAPDRWWTAVRMLDYAFSSVTQHKNAEAVRP